MADSILVQAIGLVRAMVITIVVIGLSEMVYRRLPDQFREKLDREIGQTVRELFIPHSTRSYARAILIASVVTAAFFSLVLLDWKMFFGTCMAFPYLIVIASNPRYSAKQLLVDWPMRHLHFLKRTDDLKIYYCVVTYAGLPFLVISFFGPSSPLVSIVCLCGIFLPVFSCTNIPQIAGVVSRQASFEERKRLILPQILVLPIECALSAGVIGFMTSEPELGLLGESATVLLTLRVAVVALGFVLPYALLIHVPFYVGQKRWKSREIRNIETRLETVSSSIDALSLKKDDESRLELLELRQETVVLDLTRQRIESTKNYPVSLFVVALNFLLAVIAEFFLDAILRQFFPF